MKKRETFEIMRAEDVGWPKNRIVLGKHSGRHAIRHRLKELGIALSDKEHESFYALFIARADRKKEITDEDVRKLAKEAKG